MPPFTLSAIYVVEAPGASAPFSIKPILINLEGGRYVGPILPGPLADLLAGIWKTGGSGGGRCRGPSGSSGSSGSDPKSKVGAAGGGGTARVRPPAKPVPLGQGELVEPPDGDGPPQPAWPCSLQELAPVHGVLGVLGV